LAVWLWVQAAATAGERCTRFLEHGFHARAKLFWRGS
jgi:hypothetical protein